MQISKGTIFVITSKDTPVELFVVNVSRVKMLKTYKTMEVATTRSDESVSRISHLAYEEEFSLIRYYNNK